MITAAREYLSDNPNSWLAFTNCVSSAVVNSISEQAGDRVFNKEHVDGIVVPTLLSPDVVRSIADCDDSATVPSKAAAIVLSVLAAVPAEIPFDDEEIWEGQSWFDIVDFDESGYPVLRIELDDDGFIDNERIGFGYHVADIGIEESELTNIISKAISPLQPQKGHPSSLIHRLDIIDLALLQTLASHPDLLKTLNWRTFEKLLAKILEEFGYDVELQQGTKDGGIDIFAVRHQDVFEPQRFLLQAKRYANKVGVEPVRQLAFLHAHHRATKSSLATTATFTRGAWELARQYQWQLELRDVEGIHNWIQQVIRKK